MTIEAGLTNSFRLQLLNAGHDFGSDNFMLALYTAQADLLASTTVYSPTNEVVGTGYTAGGNAVTVSSVALDEGAAVVGFDNVEWPTATIQARAGLLYNASASNASVCVIDFGADVNRVGSTFKVIMPSATANEALVRLVRG